MQEGLLAMAVGTGPAGDGRDDGGRRERGVAGPQGPPRPEPERRCGTAARRVGHPGRPAGAGDPAAGARRRRHRASCRCASYELFCRTEMLGRMAMERMLAGLSTRRYPVGLEPVGEQVSATARSTSKSAVSRKFVAMTETALARAARRRPVRAGPGRADDRRGALRRVPAAWSRWASASTGSSTRWRWSRARPRTPPSSPTC